MDAQSRFFGFIQTSIICLGLAAIAMPFCDFLLYKDLISSKWPSIASATFVVMGLVSLMLSHDALRVMRQQLTLPKWDVPRTSLFWLLLCALIAASMIWLTHLDQRAPVLAFLLRLAFDVCLPLWLLHNALLSFRNGLEA